MFFYYQKLNFFSQRLEILIVSLIDWRTKELNLFLSEFMEVLPEYKECSGKFPCQSWESLAFKCHNSFTMNFTLKMRKKAKSLLLWIYRKHICGERKYQEQNVDPVLIRGPQLKVKSAVKPNKRVLIKKGRRKCWHACVITEKFIQECKCVLQLPKISCEKSQQQASTLSRK